MLLAYRENPSFSEQRRGVHRRTVQRCVERAVAYGPLAASMTDRDWARRPTITPEAKSWLVSLACDKAKEHGYPHELWTTRLLAMKAALASVGLNQYLLVDRIYYFGARVFPHGERGGTAQAQRFWNCGPPTEGQLFEVA